MAALQSRNNANGLDRVLFYLVRRDTDWEYLGQQLVRLTSVESAGLSVYTNDGHATLVVGDRPLDSTDTNDPFQLHVVELTDPDAGTLSHFAAARPSAVQAEFAVVAAVAAAAGTVLVGVTDTQLISGESHFVLVRKGPTGSPPTAVVARTMNISNFVLPLVPLGDSDALGVETANGLTFQVARYTVPSTGESVRTALGAVTLPEIAPNTPKITAASTVAVRMTPDGVQGVMLVIPDNGDPLVYRTSDGGATWVLMAPSGSGIFPPIAMDVANARALVYDDTDAIQTIPFLSVPCFAGSTPLRLRSGAYVRADAVKAGHVLALASGGSARVHAVVRSQSARLVVVPPHAAGVDRPSRAVGLTPNHRVRNAKGAVVRADQLGLPVLTLDTPVPVYHVCLDAYAWLDAAGLVSESCAWTPEQLRQRARDKRSRAAKLDLPKASPLPALKARGTTKALTTVLEHAPVVEAAL